MAKIEVIDKKYTRITREKDPDTTWSCDDTDTDHSIQGVRQLSENDYSDLTIGFDLVPGETYHLLYAIYNTGCSFCKKTGMIEFIDLFQAKNANIAKENQERCEKAVGFSVDLITDTGQKYTFGNSWTGYFESLQGIYIEPVSVMI